MNKLKFKVKIFCDTCGFPLMRQKTVKVISSIKDEAIKEATPMINDWKKHLQTPKQNCKICQSIIDDI